MRGESIYSKLYVKYSHRALKNPRVARPFRPRVIAWAGPTAFMRDRFLFLFVFLFLFFFSFYEIDTWYKARIQKPELLPKLYVINPENIYQTLEERLKCLFFFFN